MDAQFLILIAFFAVMYFLLIRPQQKRQKEHRDMVRSVSVGDDVITIGGVHGTVAALDDETMDLTVAADGTVLRFQRSSLARVVSEPDLDPGEDATLEGSDDAMLEGSEDTGGEDRA